MATGSQTSEVAEHNAESSTGRRAVIFKPPESTNNEKMNEDEDDSFYELTLDEMKRLYSESQKQKAISDKLLPRDKREEEERALRGPARHYDQTVVRIEFPDRTTLQGTFKASETIGIVKQFVREHLKEPAAEFEIFTSPPKNTLQDKLTLDSLKLVPTAKFYIAVQNGVNVQLRPDVTSLVSFESAQEAASVSRKPKEIEQPQPSASTATAPSTKPKTDEAKAKKIPKWFKTK